MPGKKNTDSADTETVFTSSFEEKPNLPGYKVRSASPHKNGYLWQLVREDLYDIFLNLDLHLDIKDIEQAKREYSLIDERIRILKSDKKILKELLEKYEQEKYKEKNR